MASNVCLHEDHDPNHGSSKLRVTILASEWGSSKGGLSTINRELAIQLAKFSCAEVTFFLPKCSDEDKKAAATHSVSILTAVRRPGYRDELDWLSFPPQNLRIDVVVGHGVKLGHQAQIIRESHKCKWVQIVHTDPEELGMFKCYENPISTGEQKHHDEVELCQMADFVVAIGPKLTKAFHRYLSWCKKDVFQLTPGVFSDFSSVQLETLYPVKREQCSVLVFGRGDDEDFELKGFDIAARSVAALSDTNLYFVGAPYGKHEEIAKCFVDLGIPAKRLKVRGYIDSREDLKRLFCEVDLVLMPSRTEGFGLTGLEALSAGLPVLVSQNSGFGEALHSLPFGSFFVIDSEDPSTWTAAIESTWNRDRKSLIDEVKAVHCSYGKRYSWSEQCKHLIEKMFKFVDVTSSETKITAQAVGEREVEQNEDVPGTSSETEITAQVAGTRKRKLNEDFTGIQGTSSETEVTAQVVGSRKRILDEDFTGTSSETKITAQAVGEREVEQNENVPGTSSELHIIAKALVARKQKLNENSTARASYPSHVIEGIRQVYQKCEGVILPVPWCDDFNFQIEDIFTRLRIVAKEKTRGIATMKEVTNMTSIFTPHECCKQPLIVLIEGEPGMGKTTYCQKLVFDWASKQCGEWDKSFPRVDVLLFLRCRIIKSTIWNAIEEQILPDEIEPGEKEMFFQFLKENPSKVMLVLDGLDEADPQKLEMFLKPIQRKLLPGCYIVLTSRQQTGNKVRPYTDALLEIVGFTITDAECYIRKYFQHSEQLAEGLISKVELDKDLRKLTQNPLNTLLLCVIFEDLKGVLPTNRTQLYEEIVLFILRRYENKNSLSNRGKDLLLVYKKELMILGETALDCLRKGELYFDDHKGDIKEGLLKKFGFLTIQSGGSKRAPCDRYGFMHKSFQEFFSGYFLAFSVIDDVTDFHSILDNRRYKFQLDDSCYIFKVSHVFKFMCGIIALRSEETTVSHVQTIASIANETPRRVDFTYLRFAHTLINECKTISGELFTKLVRTLGESLEVVHVKGGPSSFRYGCSECMEIFFQALTFNSTLSTLSLSEWDFSTEVTNRLAQALRVNTSLSSLDLEDNSIGVEGANSLAQALRVNTSLSCLRLHHNSISAEGANSLAQALRVNTSLSSLVLDGNAIGDEGAISLAQALRVNTSLSSLVLDDNSIGDEGAISLAQALRVNTSLSSLVLDDNSIGDEGVISLAQALRVNTSLSSLRLSHNSVTAEGANSLAQALRVNTSLSSLALCWNCIGDEGANSIAQALRVNTSLSALDLGWNSIGDEGANSIAQVLRVNTSLSSLSLCDNSVNAETAQAIRANPSFSSFDFPYNFISEEGAGALSQALSVNTSVRLL
ncbi:protein NLRC3-like isoform X2 [Acropora muricata]|uniref:protein NLRC3-like isoform X2 n=1 Tax=Acropora muricata TaxID=159855 RepID=UPI0034E407FA